MLLHRAWQFVLPLVVASQVSAQSWGPWQVIGPFEHPPGGVNVDTAHAPERYLGRMRTGERGVQLDQVFRGVGDAPVRWRELPGAGRSLDVGAVDLRAVVPPVPSVTDWADTAAAYLYRRVEVPRARNLNVHMGSDDGLRVWLNGRLVFERAIGRVLNVYDEALELPLKAGTNHLFVKVVNGVGDWGFRMAPWRTVPQIPIGRAVEKGVDYFLQEQLLDGSWGYLRHLEPGPTAFRAYTLLKCGVAVEHPALQRARAFILAHENSATYALSCQILALAQMNLDGDRRRVAGLLDRLHQNRHAGGLYLYSVGGYHAHLPQDLSNTLFAALAMRAAARIGESSARGDWEDLARGAISCWKPATGVPLTGLRVAPRGFSYRPDSGVTSSMTGAGVSVLAIVREGLSARLPGKLTGPVNMGIRSGLEWLDQNFVWTTNYGQHGGYHNYFNIYGMERVGGLLGRRTVAGRDWYWEGAQVLLKAQRPDGTWVEEGGHNETELALLFLERATATASGKGNAGRSRGWSSDEPDAQINLRASGDTPLTLWVDGFHPETLQALEWSGEQGKGLRVVKVDYYAMREVPGAKIERIATHTFGGDQPAGLERFAVQHRFTANGVWLIHGRVLCQREPAEEGLVPEEVELLSAELLVEIENVVTEEQLSYARKALENSIRGARVQARASSENQGEEASRAVDGNPATRWHCTEQDSSPTLRLDFPRPIRGRRVLLSHGWPRHRYKDAPRPLLGELVLNGRTRVAFEMDPDPMIKTVIDLGRSHGMRTLQIEIQETLFGDLGRASFGFSEVEVLR